MRVLLEADPLRALEAQAPPPRLGSDLGEMPRRHVELMRAIGCHYEAQSARLVRFDSHFARPDIPNRDHLYGEPPWHWLEPSSVD